MEARSPPNANREELNGANGGERGLWDKRNTKQQEHSKPASHQADHIIAKLMMQELRWSDAGVEIGMLRGSPLLSANEC